MANFRQVYVVDEAGQPVVGKRGRIYAFDDVEGVAPLEEVTGGDGIPLAFVEVTEFGVNQAFAVPSRTQVRWISEDGLTHVVFDSLEGLEERAATATATAESVAAAMAEFMAKIGVPGGVAPLNAEGDVIDADGDVVGNDTRRAGAVIFAVGSTTARPTQSRNVMVLWLTEGEAPVNAIAGIDYWLNAGVQ